jgi:hypothetical protein
MSSSADETVEIAVEDAVGVADFVGGPVILDHAVGREDVGADLTPPLDVLLLSNLLGHLVLGRAARHVEELGAQEGHRHVAVAMLGAFVLTAHDDVGREVRDPDRRVCLVHVLSAGPGRAKRVHADVLGVDVDLDGVVDLRKHVHGRERRVPAALRVERRDPHEPVHAALDLQVAVGVLAADRERRALDAGLVAGLVVQHRDLEALAFAPPHVHAKQHLGPVLGLGTARARVDLQDGARRVVLAGQKGAQLELLGVGLESRHGALEIGADVLALAGELEQRLRFLEERLELAGRADPRRQQRSFLLEFLGAVRVSPDFGEGQLVLDPFQGLLLAVDIKETSAATRPSRRDC